ncbi:MAG: hypothetical protein DRJ64_09110, partial [Thermoprotei archaeon]
GDNIDGIAAEDLVKGLPADKQLGDQRRTVTHRIAAGFLPPVLTHRLIILPFSERFGRHHIRQPVIQTPYFLINDVLIVFRIILDTTLYVRRQMQEKTRLERIERRYRNLVLERISQLNRRGGSGIIAGRAHLCI